MNLIEESNAMKKHREWRGKIEIVTRAPLETREDLALAYTPGVAEACLEVEANPSASFDLTRRWNTVAVITNGTAVLGLGDIGPVAGMPVMEGKAALFKAFGNVDAIPLCINSKDVDTIVDTVALLEGSFGGVNLEDISAPACFEIERKLKERCSIPIFHDDQHGTAVVVLAALKNALKLAEKQLKKVKIVISGCGAAGISIAKLLYKAGARNIIMCDREGIVFSESKRMNDAKRDILKITNKENKSGTLSKAISGADVFIGVSSASLLTSKDISAMADKAIVFAMANPVPEIMPKDAIAGGAFIVGTGRSDYPNQINNVLAFPGIFRGALDARAHDINNDMLVAAANAIAGIVKPAELTPEYIIPTPLDKRVAEKVAKAVMKAAVKSGVADNGV